MEQIFEDNELNLKAYRIKNLIMERTKPFIEMEAAKEGLNTIEIDQEDLAQQMKDIQENGLQLADNLLSETLSDLNFIKNKIGGLNESYLNLSESLAITTSGLIGMPVSMASMLTMAGDFHSDKSLVQKTMTDFIEAKRLMTIVSNLDISNQGRQEINRVINTINAGEKRVNAKSGTMSFKFLFFVISIILVIAGIYFFKDNILLIAAIFLTILSIVIMERAQRIDFFKRRLFFIGFILFISGMVCFWKVNYLIVLILLGIILLAMIRGYYIKNNKSQF